MTTYLWQPKHAVAREIECLIARQIDVLADEPELAGDSINALIEGIAVLTAIIVEGEPRAVGVALEGVVHRLFVRAGVVAPMVRLASLPEDRQAA